MEGFKFIHFKGKIKMKNNEIKKSHYLLILIPISLMTLEQIFGKIGSQFISFEYFSIIHYLNIFIIMAILCLVLRSFIWLLLFRKFDIAFIYPLTSISYVIVLIVSVHLFSDSYTIGNVLGTVLISIGTYFIGSVKMNNKKYKGNEEKKIED